MSAAAGTLIAKAGVVFFMVATPVGWVGLVAVTAAASMGMNYIVKEKSGSLCDSVMEWLNTL